MTNTGSIVREREYTLNTGSESSSSQTLPRQRDKQHTITDRHQEPYLNVRSPKGQSPNTQIYNICYIHVLILIKLKCMHMPPSKQQYKMHECCKAVNELQAMTSVISLKCAFSTPHHNHIHIIYHITAYTTSTS